MANFQMFGARAFGPLGGNPQLSVGYAPTGGSSADAQAHRSADLADALHDSETAGRAPLGAGAMLTNLAAALIARRRIAEMTGMGQPDPAPQLTPQDLGAALAANPPSAAVVPAPPAGLRQGAARGQPGSPA